MDLSLSHKLFKNIRNNRWQNDFTEQEKIGRGGFASVYRAKNCFDDQQYAVKKIKLDVKDIKQNFEQEIERVLDEAKFLAQVNHQNVLRYYNSWLEATTKSKRQQTILQSKPSLFKKAIQKQNSLFTFENPDQDESEEEKLSDIEDDSPMVLFKRNSDENERSSNSSSKDESSGEFSHVVFKRNNSFANKIKDCDQKNSTRQACCHNHNQQTPVRPIKLRSGEFDFDDLPEECGTPLLGGESLDTVTLYIQTELCSETLEDYLQKRNQTLQELRRKDQEAYNNARREFMKEALLFAKQILQGVSHIHMRNIVHRDLKPSNIFLADKNCKIGDFGLIKRLHSLCAMEPSPVFAQDEEDKSCLSNDEFKLESAEEDEFEMVEELPQLEFQKMTSEPLWHGGEKSEFGTEIENITRSVGTRIYASPEQWQADQTKFDQRADIFSLGIIFLLLFHPTGTYMEQSRTINESKEGKIPKELENEFHEIARIIKRMLSINPAERPSLDSISQSLKLPLEISTDLSGVLYARKENTCYWRKKHFKLIDTKLYIFNKDGDKKAEVVYDLSEWRVQIKNATETSSGQNPIESKENEKTEKSLTQSSNLGKIDEKVTNQGDKLCEFITIESSLQLGCSFRGDNAAETLELFQKLSRSVRSF